MVVSCFCSAWESISRCSICLFVPFFPLSAATCGFTGGFSSVSATASNKKNRNLQRKKSLLAKTRSTTSASVKDQRSPAGLITLKPQGEQTGLRLPSEPVPRASSMPEDTTVSRSGHTPVWCWWRCRERCWWSAPVWTPPGNGGYSAPPPDPP